MFLIRNFFKFIDILVTIINQSMAVIGLALGVILAFINVVLRYGFDMSLTWAGELTAYLFVWSAFFAMAYGFKKGTHISVTLLLEKFPPMVAKFFMILANLISVAYLIFISYFGYQLILMLIDFEEMSVDLDIPVWIPHLVVPIAFAMAAYRAAEKVYEISITDSKDLFIYSEHEEIVKEIKAQRGENGHS